LLGLFMLTLPFEWGERSSCQGGARTFTGIDLLTERPENGVSIAVLFVTPVLIGLLQPRIRNAIVGLLLELGATFFASLGTLYCFINAIFAGGFNGSHRAYLAPWIAMLAPLLMLVDACQGAVARMREILEKRRQRRLPDTNEETAPGSPQA